jgi:enoyl-CoA hydratase/carnithine racemase
MRDKSYPIARPHHAYNTQAHQLQFANPLMRELGALRIPVISSVNGPLGGAGIG